MESEGDLQPFKDLWQNCMIHSTTEAVCETTESIMKQHSGRGCHLQPFYFSMEICLRWNLGPLHFLKDFIEEIYNREKKTYIRSTTRADKLVTRDITKSVAVANYQKNGKKNLIYQLRFGTKIL